MPKEFNLDDFLNWSGKSDAPQTVEEANEVLRAQQAMAQEAKMGGAKLGDLLDKAKLQRAVPTADDIVAKLSKPAQTINQSNSMFNTAPTNAAEFQDIFKHVPEAPEAGLPVPTKSDAGFELKGEPYGGLPAEFKVLPESKALVPIKATEAVEPASLLDKFRMGQANLVSGTSELGDKVIAKLANIGNKAVDAVPFGRQAVSEAGQVLGPVAKIGGKVLPLVAKGMEGALVGDIASGQLERDVKDLVGYNDAPSLKPYSGSFPLPAYPDDNASRTTASSVAPLPSKASESKSNKGESKKDGEKKSKDSSSVPSDPMTTAIKSAVKDTQERKEKGYGQGLDDAALLAAQEQARDDNNFAMIGKALNTIIGGATKGFDVHNDAYNDMQKNSQQGVQDILTRRKGKDEAQKFELEQRLEDPNSPESKLAQSMLKTLGYNFGEVSAGALKRAGVDYDKLVQAKQRSEAMALERQRNADYQREKLELMKSSLDQRTENQANNRYMKETKSFADRLENVQRIDGFIQAIKHGGLIPSANVVSSLSNDIAQLVANANSTALADREKAAIKTMETQWGKIVQYVTNNPQKALPDGFLKQIEQEKDLLQKKYISAMERKTKELMAGSHNDGVKAVFQDRFNTAMQNLGIDHSVDSISPQEPAKKDNKSASPKSSESYTPAQEAGIQAFMKGNNISDREEAIKILKQNGKL